MKATKLVSGLAVSMAVGALVPVLSTTAFGQQQQQQQDPQQQSQQSQQSQPQAAAGLGQPAGAVTVGAMQTATVKAVDDKARTVTLETEDGRTATLHVGKDAVNFDQIKVGDKIRAGAIDRVVVFVGKGGAPSEGGKEIVMLAPKGARPGIIIADTEQMTDKVTDVDQANRTITLQGTEGKPMTIKCAQGVDLSNVKKGDDVTVRATEGLALLDEKAGGEAQPAAGQVKPEGAAGEMGIETMTGTATVESVDKGTRTVTLKGEDGATHMVHLGKEARNFDQIKPGDKVRATLAEEVAVSMDKGGAAPGAGEQVFMARTPQGAKPGMLIAKTVDVTGKIQSVDPAKRTVTLMVEGGKPMTVKVGPQVDLNNLKSGDDVTARVTQAFGIVVESPT